MPLPPLPELKAIQKRLDSVFPEGISHRTYLVRDMAAKTVFAMLYIGAIEARNQWLAPKHVYRMSNSQARFRSDEERLAFAHNSMRPGFKPKRDRWYADNSRESIRDETLREGLVAIGAVAVREGIPTTSGTPRYALRADFAEIFDPALTGEPLRQRILEWQERHLSPTARARLRIVQRGRTARTDRVNVLLPSGESRNMEPGPSSEITKQVVEVFAPRFLESPAVIWISESGNKVVERDESLARDIGLDIRPDHALPDLILADTADPFLLIFVEVVATDGAVSGSRRDALLSLARESRIDERRVLFMSAFLDRGQSAFRKAVPNLAWGSFAWFAAEPDNIIAMDGASPHAIGKLREFLAFRSKDQV